MSPEQIRPLFVVVEDGQCHGPFCDCELADLYCGELRAEWFRQHDGSERCPIHVSRLLRP